METNYIKRFWSKVDRSGGPKACWPWTGGLVRKYGSFWNGTKMVRAHRVMWEIVDGNIPKELCVLHECDNPKCCNPGHLFLGTQVDNIKDMDRKGRRRAVSSEHVNTTKLTSGDVRTIRALSRFGMANKSELARDFGVTRTNIRYIINRTTWKEV